MIFENISTIISFSVPWHGAWRGLYAGDEDLGKQASDGEHFFLLTIIKTSSCKILKLNPKTSLCKSKSFTKSPNQKFSSQHQWTIAQLLLLPNTKLGWEEPNTK